MTKIAVLMTCFNRRLTTLASIESLNAQVLPATVELTIFLTDDASTDGTAQAIRLQHPAVRLLDGDGSLYWTGGTLRSERAALEEHPDYLMWLNDDVSLCPNAVVELLETAGPNAVAVGAVSLPGSTNSSYGGYCRARARQKFPLSRVEPNGKPQVVETMNGNVVLIPIEVRRAIGALDQRMQHNMADVDFGLRCTTAGVQVILTPTFIGSCPGNPSKALWADPEAPLSKRWKAILSFRGLPPRQWLLFTRRHLGWRWPRYFAGPYLRTLLAGLKGRGSRATDDP